MKGYLQSTVRYLLALAPMVRSLFWWPRMLATCVALGLLACGGSVDNGSSSTDPTAHGGSGTGTSSSLLADCNPGFPSSQASSSNPCYFLDGDTCYQTQDAACGCICPRDQGAVECVTGYDTQYVAGVQVMWVVCHAAP